MGKASRKINKRKEKEVKKQVQTDIQALKMQMQQQVEAEQYAEALESLAGLIKDKCYDAELMYQGAYCYFMTGDYTRAAQWVDNTLQYAPQHIAARILLARICILEDRTEAGLAVFDFILENYLSALTQEQKEEISDVLEYYGRNEPETIRGRFPSVASFLDIEDEPDSAAGTQKSAPIPPSDENSAPDLFSVAVPAENMVPEPAPEKTSDAVHADASDDKLAEILRKQVSVAEKVKLLNAFAGAYFYQQEPDRAAMYLDEALKLDGCSDETLRNRAILCAVQGEQEAASSYASRMSYTDFLLLAQIR